MNPYPRQDRNPERSEQIALEADEMLARGEPKRAVVEFLERFDGDLPEIIPRMLCFPRLDENARFLKRHRSTIPEWMFNAMCKTAALGNEADRMTDALRRPPTRDPGWLSMMLRDRPELEHRVLQEDFFLSTPDSVKWEILHRHRLQPRFANSWEERLFVAQLALSPRVDRSWKEALRLESVAAAWFDEGKLHRQASGNIGMDGILLGETVRFWGKFGGFQVPRSHRTIDCEFVLNERLRRVFRGHPLYRYTWTLNKKPGFEITRATFERFARTGDLERLPKEVWERALELSRDDIPEKMIILLNMSGLDFNPVPYLIAEFVKSGRANILAHCVRERRATLEPAIPLEALVFHLARFSGAETARIVFSAVESVAPELIGRAVDPFGLTPLCYANSATAPILRSFGCIRTGYEPT